MKKLLFLIVAMAFIAFGYTAGVFAAEKEKPMGKDAREVSAWIGKDVKNPQGQDLGKVNDFVRNEKGEVSLVIISHGGFMGVRDKKVAVPFKALSYNAGKDHVVLDSTKEQLAGAPTIGENENPTDPEFAAKVHRYFGEQR